MPINYCNECKKHLPEEQLTKCSDLDEAETEWLCADCLDKSKWYCHHCGQFCAGIPSYEFGPYAGFCDNCADQLSDSDYDGLDDEDLEDFEANDPFAERGIWEEPNFFEGE